MESINDLPFVIQIDESWYFHEDPNSEKDEYIGDSIDDEPIVNSIKRTHPGLKFRVRQMYGSYVVDPDGEDEE